MVVDTDRQKVIDELLQFAAKEILVKTGINVEISYSLNFKYSYGEPHKRMIAELAKAMKLRVSRVTAKSRKRELVTTRQVIILMLKRYFPDLTLTAIAALMGGMDHTSVLYNQRIAAERLQIKDEIFMAKYTVAETAVNEWVSKIMC
jgi:hypothetical protein